MTTKILDQWGRAFDEGSLSAPQTASMVYVPNMWNDMAVETITPAAILRVLRESRIGHIAQQSALYAQMEDHDPFLFGEMVKRKNAIASREMSVEPPEEASAGEVEAADFFNEYIEAIDLQGHLFDAADGISHGFKPFELLRWGEMEGVRAPLEIVPRPHEWFRLKLQMGTVATSPAMNRTDLRLLDGSATGAELVPFGWWVHVHRSLSGGLHRAGLFRVISWMFVYKHFALRDFAEFLEIYGIPPRIGKYDPNNITPRDKSVLYRAIQSLGHDAAGIVPNTMQIELLQAASGQPDAFERMINLCNNEYSKAINGKDPQQQGGLGGGNGQQEVGNQDVREDINIADCRQIANSFTTDVLWPIAALNFGITDIKRCPRLRFNTTRGADRKALAEAFKALQDAGFSKIPAAWAYDQAQIPAPVDGEELLTAPTPPPAMPFGNGAVPPPPPVADGEGAADVGSTTPAAEKVNETDLPGENDKAEVKQALNTAISTAVTAQLTRIARGRIAPPRDEMDNVVDAMLQGWEPAMDAIVAPLRAEIATAVDSGESLASLAARLPELLDKLDVDALVDTLSKGQFVARLAGKAGLLDPKKPSRGR